MIACIVLFGGRGNRFKHSEPKQYYKIDGKSLLIRCLDSIKTIESLSQLIIVREPIESVRVENMVAEMESFDSQLEVKFCDSGPMRSDSVLNGLKACIPSTKWVLIHDGARAFCPPILLRSLCDHLLKYKVGVVPALPPLLTFDRVLLRPERLGLPLFGKNPRILPFNTFNLRPISPFDFMLFLV